MSARTERAAGRGLLPWVRELLRDGPPRRLDMAPLDPRPEALPLAVLGALNALLRRGLTWTLARELGWRPLEVATPTGLRRLRLWEDPAWVAHPPRFRLQGHRLILLAYELARDPERPSPSALQSLRGLKLSGLAELWWHHILFRRRRDWPGLAALPAPVWMRANPLNLLWAYEELEDLGPALRALRALRDPQLAGLWPWWGERWSRWRAKREMMRWSGDLASFTAVNAGEAALFDRYWEEVTLARAASDDGRALLAAPAARPLIALARARFACWTPGRWRSTLNAWLRDARQRDRERVVRGWLGSFALFDRLEAERRAAAAIHPFERDVALRLALSLLDRADWPSARRRLEELRRFVEPRPG